MKIYLETMGCQMNQLDSELVASALRAAGHEMVAEGGLADVLLYNTCSVRDHAEAKVHSRLGADTRRKIDEHPKLIIGVLGCMAQREGAALIEQYPQIDLVVGPAQLEALPAMIESAAAGQSGVAVETKRRGKADAGDDDFDALDLSRDVSATPSSAQAFVRIMRGCDKFCAYCVVPMVRGPELSRRPDRIVEEVRRLVEAGRSEITLLGQTVNSYRWSDGGKTTRLGDLLSMLSPIAGLRRLRFVTSHPVDFGDDLLMAMRDLPNVCQYIHLPAQSGSDVMLERMNRRYSRAQYDELIDRIRATLPEVVLAGDFIVGFPGETEEDHLASAELIRRTRYRNTFIFKYSPRPGTVAAKRYADDISEADKRRRNNELLAVQALVGKVHNSGYIGKTVEVLVEGPSRLSAKRPTPARPECTQLAARTRGDHIVVFDGPVSLAGQYVQARIVAATGLTLFGERAEAEG